MTHDLAALNDRIRTELFPSRKPEAFDPVARWADLGALIESMEARGCYLLTNSTAAPGLKRMASFHKATPRGFPCVGSSEWGPYATHAEAIVRAAHEALVRPRA